MAAAAKKERVLGVDYIVIKGRGGESLIYNGASAEGDNHMHLGIARKRMTACEKPIKDFLLTYADVEVNCPACIKALTEAPGKLNI